MEKKPNDPPETPSLASDTPIYEAVVHLWRSRGRTLPRPGCSAPSAKGWVRVDPAAYGRR